MNDYFTKSMDGRIDGPNAGWKGKALWTTYGTPDYVPSRDRQRHLSEVVRFELRPDPSRISGESRAHDTHRPIASSYRRRPVSRAAVGLGLRRDDQKALQSSMTVAGCESELHPCEGGQLWPAMLRFQRSWLSAGQTSGIL
jgi:hypothetical protein